MHHRDSTPRVHNQLRRAALVALPTAAMCRLRITLYVALLACVACDTPPVELRAGSAPELDLVAEAPTDDPHPTDCRDAYYCYGDCQGGAFLLGEFASEQHDACAESCEPMAASSRDHFGWWLDALETTCAEDDSNECWWAAITFSGQDLAATMLDSCMREGASW